MQVEGLMQSDNKLQVTLKVGDDTGYCTWKTIVSREFEIGGAVVFQARIVRGMACGGSGGELIFVRFFNKNSSKDVSYNLSLTCPETSIANKCYTGDDGTWHLIQETSHPEDTTLTVSLTMDVVSKVAEITSFAPLHDDDDLTDFELHGEDGGVRIHRAVLAAASPVFRRMLAGTWKETKEGQIEVPGTTKNTLQHLKDYVYLQTLPETGLQQLLLLASYYMMPALERKCMDKLLKNMNAENTCDLIEFAATNKIPRLLVAILKAVRNDAVLISDLENLLSSAVDS